MAQSNNFIPFLHGISNVSMDNMDQRGLHQANPNINFQQIPQQNMMQDRNQIPAFGQNVMQKNNTNPTKDMNNQFINQNQMRPNNNQGQANYGQMIQQQPQFNSSL